MPPKSKADRKTAYHRKLYQLLDEYTQVLVAVADHVRSNQLHNIRKGLRGHAVVLMGKNSMMKRTIKIYFENSGNKAILNLLPLLVGNVGLIFVKGDLKQVSENVAKYKVGAPARVGSVAPIDVVVPSGNTGLDPSHTSFFQVLNIPTKINKGTVEILTPVNLIKKGDKVGSSEAALLSKLGIMPFSYGLVLISIYDNGSVFGPEVLKLTEDDLLGKFAMGVSMVTSLSLAVSYPSLAAAPHMFINAYKNVLAVAVEIDYSFPLADKFKEYLVYPSKFVGAHFGVAAHFGDGADHFGAPDATAEFAYPFPYPVRTTPSFSQPIRDWLSHPLFPMGIKWITFNQGSCSCCWITVASALVSWQFVLESGTWTYMIASPQDLIDTFERCQVYGQFPPIDGKDECGCRRGDTIFALNFIKEHGVNLVGNYAFIGHLQRHTVIPKNLTRMWIDTVVDLRNCSLDVLEAELLHHPIAGTINATRSFTEHVGEGIYRGDPVVDNRYHNAHIVLVLALRRCNAELYFEIQNSHGLGWGVNGFGKVLFPLIKPHASCRGASTSIHQVQDMDI